MAYIVLVVGALLAFIKPEVLGGWTGLAVTVLGVFSASDVTDKRLNGGTYKS